VPLILGLAVLLDLVLGEPKNRWHPVAWVGQGLGWAQQQVSKGTPGALLCGGALLVLAASLLVATLVRALVVWTTPLGWVGALFQAWLLKCGFSLRGLVEAAREVKNALAHGTLEEARRRVGWHLVSRPTHELSQDQVASATVESLAENLTDSVLAPLFFFLLFGVPGAWAYRVVNTADAMWGYRGGELEHFGKAAARLDDFLNWIPARLAGAGIVLGALMAGEAAGDAWRTMWREHRRTASPNAGWTMAAMAGALGVALEKPGAYRLGEGRLPTVEGIDRAVRVLASASGLFVALSLLTALVTP
jgi:adenosylcobinamide-phosphate synthase